MAKVKPMVVPVAVVKLDAYRIISEAVDVGAACGVRRAYKYTDTPDQKGIVESVQQEVMNALSDVLKWED